MRKRFLWLGCALLLPAALARGQDDHRVSILRTTNKAQVNAYVPRVYALRNVNPYSVIRFMRRAVQAEEGAIFTFAHPNRNSGLVLMAIPEWMVPSMDALVARIDQPNMTSSDGTLRIYRQLKHRRANVDFFNPLLDDSPFIAQFAAYLTDNGARVTVDPEQNAILIEDAPSGSENLDLALTEMLDVPTPQVIFNVSIYEIDMTNNARIGLDYIAWKNGPGALFFAGGAFAERGRLDMRNGNPAALSNTAGLNNPPIEGPVPRRFMRGEFDNSGSNFSMTYDMHSAFLDYLTVRGKARALNSARVAALSNRPATLTAGDQILYYAVAGSDPSGVRPPNQIFAANTGRTVINNGPASPEVEFQNKPALADARFVGAEVREPSSMLVPVETGLSIELRPILHANGVDVDIVTNIVDYNGFDDLGTPRINTRHSSDRVRMGEGQELILGGLVREATVKSTNKMPFLGSIPLLGYLFGQENTVKRRTEVFMVLHAEQFVRFDGDTGMRDEDRAVIDRAEGRRAIETPATSWGFDQHVIDGEKPLPAILRRGDGSGAPGN